MAPKPVVLQPVRPNAGIEVAYRKRLWAEIDKMGASLDYWLTAAYRSNPPSLATDEMTATTMMRAVRELTVRWQREFDKLAKRQGPNFIRKAARYTDNAFADRMRAAGFTVRFRPTPALRDTIAASVHENVGLIKSIAQQHLAQVEGMVMRSVTKGRDLGDLSRDLQEQLGVTKRRAAFIALDQNAKATAAIARARQSEFGVTQAVWKHSHAGKTPRPSHVKMDGQVYDIAKGMWDPTVREWIFPGELPNCRCISRPIIEGFN